MKIVKRTGFRVGEEKKLITKIIGKYRIILKELIPKIYIMDKIEECLAHEDDDIEKLLFDDVQDFSNGSRKVFVYNGNIEKHQQKIWIMTPKLKLSGRIGLVKDKDGDKERFLGLMSLILYDLNSDIKKFKEFLEKIEEKIRTFMIEQLGEEYTQKSCIRKDKTYFPVLTIPMFYNKKAGVVDFGFDIYNHLNKKIKYSDIDQGSFIKPLIEISDIWINSKTKEYSISWKVLQMKVYPEFDSFSKCIFSDGPKDEYMFVPACPPMGPPSMGGPPPPPGMPPPPIFGKKLEPMQPKLKPPTPQQPKQADKLSFEVNVAELLQTRGRLKKITDKSSIPPNPNEEIPIPSNIALPPSIDEAVEFTPPLSPIETPIETPNDTPTDPTNEEIQEPQLDSPTSEEAPKPVKKMVKKKIVKKTVKKAPIKKVKKSVDE